LQAIGFPGAVHRGRSPLLQKSDRNRGFGHRGWKPLLQKSARNRGFDHRGWKPRPQILPRTSQHPQSAVHPKPDPGNPKPAFPLLPQSADTTARYRLPAPSPRAVRRRSATRRRSRSRRWGSSPGVPRRAGGRLRGRALTVSGFRFRVSGRTRRVRRRRPMRRPFGLRGLALRRQGRLLHLSRAPGQDLHLRLDPIHLRV